MNRRRFRRCPKCQTVQAKTRLALERAGGVMVWELSQDATGEASLLEAIYRTARGAP